MILSKFTISNRLFSNSSCLSRDFANFKKLRISEFACAERVIFVAIKMGKGYGNDEGWGEGQGRVEGKWKDGLLGSCKLSGGCEYQNSMSWNFRNQINFFLNARKC